MFLGKIKFHEKIKRTPVTFAPAAGLTAKQTAAPTYQTTSE
ncbi:MAG: hypothetical protein AVDCRST_MAG56-7764 [uncultured Cytophagales bacterium]|uniref:Uncharacterized protein n=1 Tax=uncultured Cytophagales bacterium TaxID=158755 RepID=A0A6J4LQH4_9SPHI|nr:MAG: hypothetical protein AVDCRST_MAG56-7764 [uncultured Cytophagales bacterium]